MKLDDVGRGTRVCALSGQEGWGPAVGMGGRLSSCVRDGRFGFELPPFPPAPGLMGSFSPVKLEVRPHRRRA